MALADSPDLADADLPTEVEVVADGIVPLFQLPLEAQGCAGLVTGAPSYTFNWVGEAQDMRIMFEGDGDASLLVIGPDRAVACSDDSADGSNQNPVIDISGPMAWPARGVCRPYRSRRSGKRRAVDHDIIRRARGSGSGK